MFKAAGRKAVKTFTNPTSTATANAIQIGGGMIGGGAAVGEAVEHHNNKVQNKGRAKNKHPRMPQGGQ